MPEGQHLFENLLQLGPARETSNELEDLRYQWMLYKSKLKDSSYLLVGAKEAWIPQALGMGLWLSPGSHRETELGHTRSALALHTPD